MSQNDLLKKYLLIANFIKEIKEFEEYLPKITPPSISEEKLVFKKKIKNQKINEYKNGAIYNIIEKKLIMKNGEIYKGNLETKSTESYLKKGIYIFPSGDKYIGAFNSKNNFDGYGTIEYIDNSELKSQFSNGFPIKKSKFKRKLKDGTNLNFECVLKKNNNFSKSNFIFDGKTIIEKEKNNDKLYKFQGFFKNGKIIGDVSINKVIDNNRLIHIRSFCKDGKLDGLVKIEDIKPGNTF